MDARFGPVSSSRRRFVLGGLAASAAISLPRTLAAEAPPEGTPFATPLLQLPLPYGFGALEPAVDEETMQIHYGRHHAGYVRKLLAALAPFSLEDRSAEGLVSSLAELPAEIRTTVRQNGGGHLNHTIFWSVLAPPGASSFARRSALGRAIRSSWYDLDGFREALKATALSVFGSGWAWLCARTDGSLYLATTANQDNPLMPEADGETGFPVLGIDVWEHAYYLRYQNERGRYLDAIIDCLNWEEADRRYRVRSVAPEV